MSIYVYVFASFMLHNAEHIHTHKSLYTQVVTDVVNLDFLYRFKKKESHGLCELLLLLSYNMQLLLFDCWCDWGDIGTASHENIFISSCPLKMSLFLNCHMICACLTGSIFNFKVVRGVSGCRDTAIWLQLLITTCSSTQSCYCLLIV